MSVSPINNGSFNLGVPGQRLGEAGPLWFEPTPQAAPLGIAETMAEMLAEQTGADHAANRRRLTEYQEIVACVGPLVLGFDARRQASESDAKGEGTPLEAMPFDALTKKTLARFAQVMQGRKRYSWQFNETVVVPAEPEPVLVPEPTVLPRQSRRGRRIAPVEQTAPTPPLQPVTPPQPQTRSDERMTLEGWPLEAHVFRNADLAQTRAQVGRQFWVEDDLQNPPEMVVYGTDGKFYCLETRPHGPNFGYVSDDALPKGMPIDPVTGKPAAPEFGSMGPIFALDIGGGRMVRCAEFRPAEPGSMIKYLARLALEAGVPPEAFANEQPAPQPAEDRESVETADAASEQIL